tara:strand:- start:63 stop:872 length:810 start_codon:yes stop_codon:yes gene_type:complete
MKNNGTLVNRFEKIDLPSYGGNDLATNIENAEKAIAKVQYTERIWNKSRSQFMLKHLTCSQADGWMRLRQVSAEMARKRMALSEAKYGYMEKITRAEIKRGKIPQDETMTLESRLLEIQAAKLESQAQEALVKMEGAMKEVETLAQMHDSLKEILGDINEEEFEKAQVQAHIKRAIMQATREVRESGVIKAGNQEYLEQCGVCVTTAFKEIQNFLKQENEMNLMNTSLLHQFVDDFATRYRDTSKIQMKWLGFNESVDTNLTFTPEEMQ